MRLQHDDAIARFDSELATLVSMRKPAVAMNSPSEKPQLRATDGVRHGHVHVHRGIEVSHHLMKTFAPFELMAVRMCAPANDHGPVAAQAAEAVSALRYVPGALQQAAIQLCTSVAMVCVPSMIAEGRGTLRTPEIRTAQRRKLLAELRPHAPTIATETAVAGLAEVATEIVGLLTRQTEIVCKRLIRAIRHAMFPALQALRILLIPSKSTDYRESIEIAVKLFIEAGVIGTGVLLEHHLHTLLTPVFGTYAGPVAVFCIAILCCFACERANAMLDKADIVGIRRQRESDAIVASARAHMAAGDRRIAAMLEQVRSDVAPA